MRRFALTWALLALSACAGQPKLAPKLTNYDSLPGWSADNHAEALQTFRRSCKIILKSEDGAAQGRGLLAAEASVWKPLCQRAMRTDVTRARRFFETEFVPYLPDGEPPHGLFTGYYEPLLEGSRKKTGAYRIPVYGLPQDVESGVPYYSRAEIEAGALRGRKLEILWVDDAVALFFAHIQGSARVALTSGRVTRIAYAGKNNQPYVALGKVMKERGLLEEVNMFTIRDWLKRNPAQAKALMQENPSYVFFKEIASDGWPIGAQGTEVTPGRSLAVDPRFIPYGLPLYVLTELPQTPYGSEEPYRRLMIAQDTGGAIKGTVRGDIFFGTNKKAEALAGMMKGKGNYVLLLPKAVAAGL